MLCILDKMFPEVTWRWIKKKKGITLKKNCLKINISKFKALFTILTHFRLALSFSTFYPRLKSSESIFTHPSHPHLFFFFSLNRLKPILGLQFFLWVMYFNRSNLSFAFYSSLDHQYLLSVLLLLRSPSGLLA